MSVIRLSSVEEYWATSVPNNCTYPDPMQFGTVYGMLRNGFQGIHRNVRCLEELWKEAKQ